MPLESNVDIRPATGKLGVLLPGMGAVGTTFIAGCLAIRKGLAEPIGSLTQMGTIRIGPRPDDNVPLINDYVPLAQLDDLAFGGWDVFADDAYVAASRAGVLDGHMLEQLGEELRAIEPMPAVFEQAYVKQPPRRPHQDRHLEVGPGRAAHGRHPAASARRTAATASSPCGAGRPRSTPAHGRPRRAWRPSSRASATPPPRSPPARSTPTPC